MTIHYYKRVVRAAHGGDFRKIAYCENINLTLYKENISISIFFITRRTASLLEKARHVVSKVTKTPQKPLAAEEGQDRSLAEKFGASDSLVGKKRRASESTKKTWGFSLWD